MDIFPDSLASEYRNQLKEKILRKKVGINLVGYLVKGDPASKAYAEYTKAGCSDVGISFHLVEAEADQILGKIKSANSDPSIHGIFVYYPIFRDERDSKIKDIVSHKKDVEGLTSYWMTKLYANERFDDPERKRKAILPCTPLAILKLLEKEASRDSGALPFSGQTVTIFNRSEVVGKPLAYMLKNDGAQVFSFALDGGFAINEDSSPQSLDREHVLKISDIVITGVPSKEFKKVQNDELKPGALCLNFSYIQNFDDSVRNSERKFIVRVGTLTVAMCLRNALRLYENYHESTGDIHAAK